MNEANTYDVAIIGAGPAGCACALALRDARLKVVLIDKATFPRDKVCGDAVPCAAFEAMDYINSEWGKQIRKFGRKFNIDKAVAVLPNGKTITRKWSSYTYNSKRVDFDNFLRRLVSDHTEINILENKRIQDLSISEQFATCTFNDKSSITASIVIGCDGANSVVTRQVGRFDIRGDHVTNAVRGYFYNVQELRPGVNEVHFFKELMPGYFWIFPLADGWSNVGFGTFSDKIGIQKKKMNNREILAMIIRSFPSIAPRFENAELIDGYKGFALPLGTSKRSISGKRFMLCGDAAALIDPVGGNGIDNAMWSGIFAAEQAIKCFREKDFSAECIKQYDKMVYKKIGKRLRRGTLFVKMVQRFPFLLTTVFSIIPNNRIMDRVIKFFKI